MQFVLTNETKRKFETLLQAAISSTVVFALGACASKPASVTTARSPTLEFDAPIEVMGRAGGFDFITYDSVGQNFVVAHKGAGTGDIFDPKTRLVESIKVGDAQGVAVDTTNRRYFFGNDKAESIVIVDAKTNAKLSEIKVKGAVDALVFDEKSGLLYAAKDDGDRIWVIDPKKKKVVDQILIPDMPETMQIDSAKNVLYANLKKTSRLAVIDLKKRRLIKTLSTLPAENPHGLVLDADKRYIYSAGVNGKLVSINLEDGAVFSVSDIAAGNDQIAYDAAKENMLTSGRNSVSLIHVAEGTLSKVAESAAPVGARTIAFDPSSSTFWIAYGNEAHSYFQRVQFH